ncbi:hypothetical protein HZB94_04410 [Candidatus Falkowbacteria bacterium]|nr:hypothetical protein [Candidatus Falkowbacteria bacterium]
MQTCSLITVTVKKPFMIVDMARRSVEEFRISCSPGKYELEPVNVEALDVKVVWYVIKGTQYGLPVQEWKTHVQEWTD